LLGVIILKAKNRGIRVMRKIAVLALIILAFGMATAFAEVKTFPDNFTNGLIVRSECLNDKEFKVIHFFKYIDQPSVKYSIYFSKETMQEFAFEGSFVEIKVDNNPVQKINVEEVVNFPIPRRPSFVTSFTRTTIPNDVITEIKTAKRVALRFHFMNGITSDFILPDSLLSEWQQAINTEK